MSLMMWERGDANTLRQRIITKSASAAKRQRIANAKADGSFYQMSGRGVATLGHAMTATVASDSGIVLIEPISWRVIAAEVCKKHGISFATLISKRRPADVCEARHEFFWRCRQETTLSLPQLGARCGGRDHTTVLHGVRAHERRMRNEQASMRDSGQISTVSTVPTAVAQNG